MSSITPVIWEARTAHDIAAAFNMGDHAISTAAAGTTWGTITGSWGGEVAQRMVSAMAKLTTGMQGENGTAVLLRLTGFAAWVGEMAAQTEAVGVAHGLHSITYGVAFAAMPSVPEIAAMDLASATAATVGAAVGVGPEVAAAGQQAMNLQAALTMDGYELGNVPVMLTPVDFPGAPPIANSAEDIGAFLGNTGNAITDAIQNAASGAQGAAQTVQAIGSQIQSVAGQVAPAAQALTSAGSQLATSAAGVGSQALSGASGLGNALGAAGVGGPMAAGTLGAGALGAGVLGGGLSGVSFGAGALPDGWGATPMGGTSFGGSGMSGANAGSLADTERSMLRPSTGSAALGQPRRTNEEEEQEHETPEYLRNFEHFADGRTIGPAVLGSVFEAEAGR